MDVLIQWKLMGRCLFQNSVHYYHLDCNWRAQHVCVDSVKDWGREGGKEGRIVWVYVWKD